MPYKLCVSFIRIYASTNGDMATIKRSCKTQNILEKRQWDRGINA